MEEYKNIDFEKIVKTKKLNKYLLFVLRGKWISPVTLTVVLIKISIKFF